MLSPVLEKQIEGRVQTVNCTRRFPPIVFGEIVALFSLFFYPLDPLVNDFFFCYAICKYSPSFQL